MPLTLVTTYRTPLHTAALLQPATETILGTLVRHPRDPRQWCEVMSVTPAVDAVWGRCAEVMVQRLESY